MSDEVGIACRLRQEQSTQPALPMFRPRNRRLRHCAGLLTPIPTPTHPIPPPSVTKVSLTAIHRAFWHTALSDMKRESTHLLGKAVSDVLELLVCGCAGDQETEPIPGGQAADDAAAGDGGVNDGEARDVTQLALEDTARGWKIDKQLSGSTLGAVSPALVPWFACNAPNGHAQQCFGLTD